MRSMRSLKVCLALTIFIAIGASASAEPDPQQAKTIAEIEKYKGKVEIDEKSPDRPIVKVTFPQGEGAATPAGGPDKLDYRYLQLLQGLPKLRALELRYVAFSDEGLKQLSTLTSLETLTLFHTRTGGWLKGDGYEHLKQLKNLHTLNLREFLYHCEGLKHLEGMANLRTLDLADNRFLKDAGVQHIKGVTQLRSLNLDNCQELTDAGLEHLTGLTNLETLSLRKNPKISDAAIRKLQQALAKTKIER